MIKQNNMNNKNNMLALSQERFSARKFTSQAVSQEDLDYIMECVRLAPSAVNRQPWHWLIVRSDEAKEKLQECYDREWFKTAPMYIVGMKNVNENWVRRYDEKPHGDIDVAIAAEHLCLAATERGLGTCWVCNYDTDKMQQFFPREGFEAVVIIPLAYCRGLSSCREEAQGNERDRGRNLKNEANGNERRVHPGMEHHRKDKC